MEKCEIKINGLKPSSIGSSRGFLIHKKDLIIKSGYIYDIVVTAIHDTIQPRPETNINISVRKR